MVKRLSEKQKGMSRQSVVKPLTGTWWPLFGDYVVGVLSMKLKGVNMRCKLGRSKFFWKWFLWLDSLYFLAVLPSALCDQKVTVWVVEKPLYKKQGKTAYDKRSSLNLTKRGALCIGDCPFIAISSSVYDKCIEWGIRIISCLVLRASLFLQHRDLIVIQPFWGE